MNEPTVWIVIEPEDEDARAALLVEIDELITEGVLSEVRADSPMSEMAHE